MKQPCYKIIVHLIVLHILCIIQCLCPVRSYGWFLWRTAGLFVQLYRCRLEANRNVTYVHVPLWRDPEEEVERLFTCKTQVWGTPVRSFLTLLTLRGNLDVCEWIVYLPTVKWNHKVMIVLWWVLFCSATQ